jgi:hypothetical protein
VTSTETAIAPARPIPLPDRIGQGTAVEQARAVAQVQAQVLVAQQCPRDIDTAIREMKQSCTQQELADRAFYRYARGGENITGPSVKLARELARCFGNVEYGETELRRDDEYGQSEMQAFAWDLERNTRAVRTFIVPHRRDTRNGSKPLTDARDVYENNANAAARRLREAIFAILPPWFIDRAVDLCNQTLANGGGIPLATRITNCIDKFDAIGIHREQLEQKLGRPAGRWSDHDVAQLGVIFKSVQRGEISADDEFPPQQVTAAEITGKQAAAPAAAGEGSVDPDLAEHQRHASAGDPDPDCPHCATAFGAQTATPEEK